jgi:hypothetical protein
MKVVQIIFQIEILFLSVVRTWSYFQPEYDYSCDLFNLDRVSGDADDPKQKL